MKKLDRVGLSFLGLLLSCLSIVISALLFIVVPLKHTSDNVIFKLCQLWVPLFTFYTFQEGKFVSLSLDESYYLFGSYYQKLAFTACAYILLSLLFFICYAVLMSAHIVSKKSHVRKGMLREEASFINGAAFDGFTVFIIVIGWLQWLLYLGISSLLYYYSVSSPLLSASMYNRDHDTYLVFVGSGSIFWITTQGFLHVFQGIVYGVWKVYSTYDLTLDKRDRVDRSEGYRIHETWRASDTSSSPRPVQSLWK